MKVSQQRLKMPMRMDLTQSRTQFLGLWQGVPICQLLGTPTLLDRFAVAEQRSASLVQRQETIRKIYDCV